jgi:hypothetical protein
MRTHLLILVMVLLSDHLLIAQIDCSNPKLVAVCPSYILVGESNAGAGDDGTASCNITGEDVVYEVSAPNGAAQLFVSVQNASGPYSLYVREMDCTAGLCYPRNSTSTNATFNFPLSDPNNITLLYVFIDATNTITYDISFGADTGSVFINLPNLLGNLQLDSSGCTPTPFQPAKPFFEVTYNGVPQTHPMTLAPLGVPGNLCVTTYFKNTTGLEGVKKFQFGFNPAGYASVTGPVVLPGFYNIGTWNAISGGYNWHYSFNDAAPLGRGDFLGIPNTCLAYEFCFAIVPVSNDPALTNVEIKIYGDGFGAPISGWFPLGCCPVPFANCLASGFGSSSSASGFAFAFADPGGPLPIELLSFEALADDDKVNINWVTATETNNDYFLIERSTTGSVWEDIYMMDGAGNSNESISYKYTDRHPLPGVSYYRLKQVDFDGHHSFSEVVKIKTGKHPEILIYPNPARDYITIEKSNSEAVSVTLSDIAGRVCDVPQFYEGNKQRLALEGLASGMYFVLVTSEGTVLKNQKVIIQ